GCLAAGSVEDFSVVFDYAGSAGIFRTGGLCVLYSQRLRNLFWKKEYLRHVTYTGINGTFAIWRKLNEND
ncbi:MAG: hypothetical protein O3A71_04030, partial [Proteobacteria bacterium]|nr:hypothetical protein [Pseudomonadota bacterium]